MLFAFGVTTGTAATGQSTYVVDNGGNVKFAIIKGGTTSSTLHLADMSSLQYKGKELLAPYSATSRYSHYEQGLGGNTVITTATGGATGSRWILVTCDDSNETSGGVIQYYGVRENDNNVYLLSLPTDVNNGPGEGRFLAYLDRSVFSTPEVPSDNAPHSASDVVSTIEGGDVFGHTDGASTVQTTSSKFFGMGRRMIDNAYHGLAGSAGGTAVGAWMYMGNREHSAGGPFFKDIDFQSSATQVELYNCIFTGHTQTESYRQGLHTYALQLTGGTAPTTPDYSWLESVKDSSGNLLVQGLIPASGRGTLTGTATGMVSGHQTVVGLANGTAQYWAYANSSTGAYTISGIQPGTYTETLYDNELEVGTKTVTITAGQTTAANIANTFYVPSSPVFRIGTWDGTPIGFMNTEVADAATGARKVEIMHPQDVRMTAWNSTPNFVVGTNTDAQWPAYQFMGVNNGQRITFNLTSAQVQNLTLRIGITWGFSGARPKITVNSGQTYAWTSANPSASSDLNSRGITRGTWRGDNQLYTFGIPASAFRAGTNTIDVPLISGSYAAGQTWLSPNVSYDAIDLVPTTGAGSASISSVIVTPANSTVLKGGSKAFAAVAKDASGNVIPANLDWSVLQGIIDANGNYVAPATTGTDTITALATRTRTPGYSTSSSSTSAFNNTITGTGSTTVTIVDGIPTVATAAAASPNPSYTKQATLTALGADDGGESNLTYTWSVLGTPPAAVTFSAANGTNAGKSTLATFGAPGSYSFQVTITDANGNSVTSQTGVTVKNADARYLADETAGTTLADATGNANAANLTGSYTFGPGVGGNAVKLTGGYATLPTGIVSGLSDFTIGAWVKPDSIANWQRIFDFGTGTSAYMFLTTRPSTTGGLRFTISTNGGAGEQQVNTTSTLTAGVWTHVAVTLSGNTATLYVNGVAVGSNANVTLRPSSLGQTANNYVGKSQFSADPALLASVDDFRLYGRALTSAEVKALAVPTLVTAAAASANPAGGFATNLSALGDDAEGEANLTYTWSTTGTPPGTVTYSVNGTNAAKGTTATFSRPGTYSMLVTITNVAGKSVTSAVNVTVQAATVAGRYVYYNNSRFDGNDAAANAADDAAIATDKSALLPGNTATFANYTSYSRGINGLMIDVGNLANAAALSAADFAFKVGNSSDPSTWAAAPAPTTVLVRAGAGANGSDRVELVFADGAVAKQWLQITLLADANTGLAGDDVFYFGNAIGETGNSTTDAMVNATDVSAIQANPRGITNRAPVDFRYDINRDGLVNATDVSLAQANATGFTTALKLIAVPAATTALAASTAAATTTTLAVTSTSTTTGSSRASRDAVAALFGTADKYRYTLASGR